MINITDPRERARIHAATLRAMDTVAGSYERELKPVFGRQFLTAAKFVENGIIQTDVAVDREQVRMRNILANHYRRTATVFNKLAMDGVEEALGSEKSIDLGQSGQPGRVFLEQKGPKDVFWASLNGWIRKEAAQKVVKIGATTKRRIANTIGSGMREGLSNRDIAKNLRSISKVANPRRARNIARNETHTAAVYSINESMESTKVKMEREWGATKDERVRMPHALANGQRREMKEPFDVGGDKLDYPGDPKGKPRNVILCRCIVMYHTVKHAIEKPKPMPPVEEEVSKRGWAWGNDAKTLGTAENRLKTRMKVLGDVENPTVNLTWNDRNYGQMSLKAANSLGREYVKMANKYPELIKQIKTIEYGVPSPSFYVDTNVWAYGNGGIWLSPKFWNQRGRLQSLVKGLKTAFKTGFHPSSKMEHIFVHEAAHSIRIIGTHAASKNLGLGERITRKLSCMKGFDYKRGVHRADVLEVYYHSINRTGHSFYDLSANKYFTAIRKQAQPEVWRIGMPNVVSRYATKNSDEFLSEAFVRYDEGTTRGWLTQFFKDIEIEKVVK